MFDDIGEWGAHLPGAAPVHIQRTAESGAAVDEMSEELSSNQILQYRR